MDFYIWHLFYLLFMKGNNRGFIWFHHQNVYVPLEQNRYWLIISCSSVKKVSLQLNFEKAWLLADQVRFYLLFYVFHFIHVCQIEFCAILIVNSLFYQFLSAAELYLNMNSFLVIFVEIEREIRYQMTKASSLLLLCQWKEKRKINLLMSHILKLDIITMYN